MHVNTILVDPDLRHAKKKYIYHEQIKENKANKTTVNLGLHMPKSALTLICSSAISKSPSRKKC